jgi:mannose-6-phosphate isomerase
MSLLRPRRLSPRLVPKVWGSKDLGPWFPTPVGEPIGEVHFEGADDEALLVKLIFTSEYLSVQVHPIGKTESWHIVKAENGARIAAGFRTPITREELRAHAGTANILDVLAWFPSERGDTFLIPAGTVHTIGAGLILWEIQQNSDAGFRLYDFGRNRELQIDDAVRVSDLGAHAPRSVPNGETLAACPHFRIDKLNLAGNCHRSRRGGECEFWIAVSGSGEIAGLPICSGEVWFVPAGSPEFEVTGDLTLLIATPSSK